MKITPPRIKTIIVIVVLALFAWLSLAGGAQAQGSLTPQEQRGKQIYLKGDGGAGDEITAILGSSELELSASSFPCANCHGLTGEGTREGGLQPPPVTWATLTAPHRSELTGRTRAAYDEAGVARAIGAGLDVSGAKLHPGMPHFRMREDQMADLIAYLRKLGKEVDVDPGLEDARVRVGAALPISGPLREIGEDIKATLEAYFTEINSQGGIYNRKLELVVEDSRGEPAGTLEASRRLVEVDKAFALVASFEPSDSRATNEFLKQSEVPLIGPVTLSPRLSSVPNEFIFYLLPNFNDQARVLVDFAAKKSEELAGTRTLRIAVIYADTDFDEDALTGLRSQAKMRGIEIAAEQPYEKGHFSASIAAEKLSALKPDYIFFFGGAEEFARFAREMKAGGLSAGLLSSVVMIGRGALELPESVAEQTFLAYPSALPSEEGFAEFMGVMKRGNVTFRNSGFQRAAFAAAKVLIEGMKLNGRQLSRAELIDALEQLRDFKTGVVPPVTFGLNRRVGAIGSYVVGVDLARKQFVPLTSWIVPGQTR